MVVRPMMLVFLVVGLLLSATLVRGDEPIPATLLWEGDHLAQVRAGDFADDPVVARALKGLRKRADKALGRGPYSVVTHGDLPPSGDPHDYVSYGTYWWPNPDTPDGLPYVRRDGVANKELIAKGDRAPLSAMSEDVVNLSLAGYLLKEPKHSQHAAEFLRTWFLDPETRMNPHLNHGQMVRGVNSGRCYGIIDTARLVECIDSALVLEASEEWTPEDAAGLRAWFRDYMKWLTESPMGKQEGSTKNNHATYYDVQVSTMALYAGDRELAQRVLGDVAKRRMATQIKPDGRQPEEIARTRGLAYSMMNLRGFCLLARLGEHVDVGLWQEERLRVAADFLHPYLAEPSTWPTQEISAIDVSNASDALQLLATRLDEPKYLELSRGDAPGNADNTPLVHSTAPRR